MTYFEFTNIMKAKRLSMNLTGKEAAERLYISPVRYSRIESGKYEPDFELLLSILKLYKIDIYDLITKEKPKRLNFD